MCRIAVDGLHDSCGDPLTRSLAANQLSHRSFLQALPRSGLRGRSSLLRGVGGSLCRSRLDVKQDYSFLVIVLRKERMLEDSERS
jgi:hypothetical protein